jgi:hypothetical protein
MSAGAPGAAATMHGWDADTKQAEGTIVFGRAVSKAVADDGVVQAGTLFVGISMRDITLIHDTADQYESGDNVAVMTRGDIWVRAKEAVHAQTAVKYDTSTGELGKAAGTAITGAVWVTSAGVGEMAICRLSDGQDVTT